MSGFFLGFGPFRVVFHGVGVDVVWFSCFSALIVATSRGSGLQQQQLFFCAVDLGWFFIMEFFAWFLKSRRRGWLQLPTEFAGKHKKPLRKHCSFFLEKIACLCYSIKQLLEQKQLNTHLFLYFTLI